MNVLIILVPVSLILSATALGAFLWSLRNAQYDDLEGDAWRILSDDDGQTTEDDPASDPVTHQLTKPERTSDTG